jgi:cytochrome c-type biogenesis protein CcmH/NrfG
MAAKKSSRIRIREWTPVGAKKMPGYVKSENVIWLVAMSLLIGFIGGVAFGIFKSGRIVDPHQAGPPAAMDAERRKNIDILKAKTEENPDDLQAWIQLGHQYFDAGQPAEAIDAYEKALSLQPNNADVWTDLGVMYRRNDQPEKAIDAFDRAINIDSSHEISRFNKGIVLFHDLKDQRGALAAWESLLALNPDATSPGGQKLKDLVEHIKTNHQDKQ